MTEGQPPRSDSPQSPQSPASPQSPPPQSPPPQSPPPQYAPPGHSGPTQQQHYGPPPGQQPGNGMAVAALVLGIVGALFGTILGWLVITAIIAIVLGILGIIFGIVGRRRYDRNPAIGRKGMATVGLVLSIIALIGGLFWVIAVGIAVDEGLDQLNEQDFDQLQEDLEQLETQ